MISKTAISRETDRTECRALLFALTVKTVTCIRLMVVTAFFLQFCLLSLYFITVTCIIDTEKPAVTRMINKTSSTNNSNG